jgi:hypothetical protein
MLHAGGIGGMVHAIDQDRPSAVTTTATTPAQMIARRLRLGGGDDLSRNLQRQRFLFRKLRGGLPGSNATAPNTRPHAIAKRLMVSFFSGLYARCVGPSN